MKPVHVGLLVLGAALAGGLAVRMTQPPPIPVASVIPAIAPVSVPPAVAIEPPVVTERKPSPIPVPEAVSPAPPPIYTEPAGRPAIVRPPVIAPARRQEIAHERPLDVPPLPPDTPVAPASNPLAPVQSAPVVPVEKVVKTQRAVATPRPLRQVTLRPGMTIVARIEEALSSDRSVPGNSFNGSLAEPLVIDGLVVAERGARITGRVLDAQKAGRVSGVSMMELTLSSVMTADGQRISIATDPWTKRGDTSRGADAGKIGGGAALGAIVGAVAGGGTGAVIGAGIGGGAGAGAVMVTRGKPAEVPSETVVIFRVSYAVTITERRTS
jgi:hypothetical protein